MLSRETIRRLIGLPDLATLPIIKGDVSNRVTIYVWSANHPSTIQGDAVGHASLRTYVGGSEGNGIYASFWPSFRMSLLPELEAAFVRFWAERKIGRDVVIQADGTVYGRYVRYFIDNYTVDITIRDLMEQEYNRQEEEYGKSVNWEGAYGMYNNTYEDDVMSEERPADIILHLYTLDVSAINKAFVEFKRSNYNWAVLIGSNLKISSTTSNCSGLVYRLLCAGGLDQRIGEFQSRDSTWMHRLTTMFTASLSVSISTIGCVFPKGWGANEQSLRYWSSWSLCFFVDSYNYVMSSISEAEPEPLTIWQRLQAYLYDSDVSYDAQMCIERLSECLECPTTILTNSLFLILLVNIFQAGVFNPIYGGFRRVRVGSYGFITPDGIFALAKILHVKEHRYYNIEDTTAEEEKEEIDISNIATPEKLAWRNIGRACAIM